MTNILTRTTELVKLFWNEYIDNGSVAVDMTVGNGCDTVYLSEHCGKVYGFDIQEEAISKTKEKLSKDNVKLICDSHENVKKYVKEEVDLLVFNLGYLPHGNENITTHKESTLKAIRESLDILKVNGLLSIVIYWGHEEGKKEREGIKEFVKELDSHYYHAAYMSFPNQDKCPPEIILVTKRKKDEENEEK